MKALDGEQVSDEELMRRFQEGDNDALGLLYERHSGNVLSDCRRMVRC